MMLRYPPTEPLIENRKTFGANEEGLKAFLGESVAIRAGANCVAVSEPAELVERLRVPVGAEPGDLNTGLRLPPRHLVARTTEQLRTCLLHECDVKEAPPLHPKCSELFHRVHRLGCRLASSAPAARGHYPFPMVTSVGRPLSQLLYILNKHLP